MADNLQPIQPKKIAIIGGGILGLSTAFYLKFIQKKFKEASEGSAEAVNPFLCEIDIFEKEPDLGGLAQNYSLPEIQGNENGKFEWHFLEKYYHHFFASDNALKELLANLGIAGKLKWHDAKMGIYMDGKLFDFSKPIDILKFPPLNLINRLRLGAVSFFLQKWPFDKGLAGITAIDWCERYFGKTVTSVMWKPLLEAKFSDTFDKISMLWLRTRIRDRASSRPSLFKNEQLGYIDGSLHTLIEELEKALKRDNINIFTKVHNMSMRSTNSQHHLKYKLGNKEIVKDYDIVIATIPPKDLIQNFDPPAKFTKELSNIKFLGAICITLIIKNKFMPYYWLTINDPTEPFVAVIEHTNLISSKHYNNKHILYLGKYLDPKDKMFDLTEEQLLKIITKFLKKLNANFDPSWIEDIAVQRSTSAQHIVDTKYKPTSQKTGKKGLYYAHFSQIYPHDRGINYAVAQGFYLAKLITQQWKN